MKLIFVLTVLTWDIAKVASEVCGKPEVRRTLMHIYRTTDVDVTVHHCYYVSKHETYSDITNNCISAFNTRLFIDKWTDENYVDDILSPVKLEKYITKANTMQNEIRLRSGTVCRYDRGFCYDPKESLNFAAVWEITREEPVNSAENLVEIFYGWIDTWKLRNNSLTYLVFQDRKRDRSFFLQLEKHDYLGDKDFWYTNRYGIVASSASLKDNIQPVPRLNQEYFPLKPKEFVSEQVLRSCDIQHFPLDFGKDTYQNNILDQNNLLVILNIFQKQLLETKKNLADVPSGDKGNPVHIKDVTDLRKDMKDAKKSLLTKDQEIAKIRSAIGNMQYVLSQTYLDGSKLQENIKQILAQTDANNIEFNQIKDKLEVLQNQFSKLRDDSNGKKIIKELAKLESNFTLLETTLLEKNKEVFKMLFSKDKLTDDIKSSLINFYKELQNKDTELTKGQEIISNRLFNIELDLNKQNNDIKKLQNHTFIWTHKQNDLNMNVKGFDKLQLKYNDILAKLNLHDLEIGKCQNYTILFLSNKDKLLKELEEDIRNIQRTIVQSELRITHFLNKDDVLEKQLNEVDRNTMKLKGNIESERQNFILMSNENKNEIKRINEKSEECQRAINHISNSKSEDFEDVEKNLTDVRNILTKQDDDILKLQVTLNTIYDKLSTSDKDFTEAINDYKRYVNTRLQTKDEEITQIHDILIKKNGEINKLGENLEKIDEKNKILENKISMCQMDLDKKSSEKDDEIRRIQHNLDENEKKFHTELQKRDQEYKKLETKINKIEQDIQTVDVY